MLWSLFAATVPTTRQVTYRANTGFPDKVTDPNTHVQCGSLLSVSADGEATVLTVRDCRGANHPPITLVFLLTFGEAF